MSADLKDKTRPAKPLLALSDARSRRPVDGANVR